MFTEKDHTIHLLYVLASIGVSSVLFATRWGVGISPDSLTYIYVARNVLNGQGITMPSGAPMTHYPPLFPILLSVIGAFGIDPMHGARWLNSFLFGANILLVGLVIERYSHCHWTAILGSFLILGSVDMLYIHSMAWTEPLFVFLGLLGLVLLAAYIKNSKFLLLIASSSVIGLAFLTRYSGVTLVATGIVGIFFFTSRRHLRGLNSVVFATISCFPIFLWASRSLYVADKLYIANRKVVYHPITIGHIKAALDTISTWLLPETVPGIVRASSLLVVVTGLSILIIVLLQRERRPKTSEFCKQHLEGMLWVLCVFIFIYGLFLSITISFFDAHTPLDNRILSPLYISGLVLILCLVSRLLRSSENIRVLKVGFVLLNVVFAVSYLLRGTGWVIHAHSEGLGYASRAWKHSETMNRVKALPSGVPIFTNGADVIYFITGRAVSKIPAKLDPMSRETNKSYLSQLAEMRNKLEGGGRIVYFDSLKSRWYLPSEEELIQILRLRLIAREADGSIYKVECREK